MNVKKTKSSKKIVLKITMSMTDGKSRQTYTRQERFLLMVMSEEVKQSDDSDLLVFVC